MPLRRTQLAQLRQTLRHKTQTRRSSRQAAVKISRDPRTSSNCEIATGPAPGTIRPVTTDTLTLRADRWFDLAPQWQLALRTDLPFVAKNPINSDDPDGHFLYGLGDADVQAALIHTFDARWAAGVGVRLFAPTGQDNLTTENGG